MSVKQNEFLTTGQKEALLLWRTTQYWYSWGRSPLPWQSHRDLALLFWLDEPIVTESDLHNTLIGEDLTVWTYVGVMESRGVTILPPHHFPVLPWSSCYLTTIKPPAFLPLQDHQEKAWSNGMKVKGLKGEQIPFMGLAVNSTRPEFLLPKRPSLHSLSGRKLNNPVDRWFQEKTDVLGSYSVQTACIIPGIWDVLEA